MSQTKTESNAYLEDRTLPSAARALMSTLLEIPIKITARNLSQYLKELPNSLYGSLEVLAEKGYLTRTENGSVANPFDIEYRVSPCCCPHEMSNAVHIGEKV